MRYWRNREISDRLISDRVNRKREPELPELPAAIGFEWEEDDNG